MKSALVGLLIFIWMPIMLFKPQVGVLVWSWVSHMGPQTYTYGFAASFPFLVVVGVMTAASMLISKEKSSLPAHPIIVAILLFVVWTWITSALAFDFAVGQPKLEQFMKTVVFALLSAMIMQTPNRLRAFVYVMVASLLFIAVKGGAFTLLTGGVARVQGAGGMMGDNNQLAMAMSMLFPLSVFLAQYPPVKIMRWPLIGAAISVPLSVIGTQSRGGFVALAAVLFMFLMKSKHKVTILVIAIPLGVAAINFMPDSWTNRMQSTEEATDDDSFMGRVSMWKFSSNVTKDHPIEGGGFNVFYLRHLGPMYMPSGWRQRAPHSIYFEVLGEHGYVGLLLFLTMLFTGWFAGGTNAKRFKEYEETKWIGDLSAAIQVSLVGYAVGGLTVNIAIFDLFYHLLIVLVICRAVGDRIIEKGAVMIQAKQEQAVKTKGKWKPPQSQNKPQPAE